MDEIIIRQKRPKVWQGLFGAVVGILMCFVLVFALAKELPPFSAAYILYLPFLLFLGIITLIALLICLWVVYDFGKSLLYGDRVLLIDQKKVQGKLLQFGVIHWKDVERIYLNEVEGKKYIEFVLKNENKFLKGFSKREKRELRMKKDPNHEIVYLSLEKIEMPAEELFEKMLLIFEKKQVMDAPVE